MNTTYLIPSLDQWRSHVAKMADADALNRGLSFLDSSRVYAGRHPFKGDELDHAKAILRKRARELNVTWYESKREYRDNQPITK